MRKTDSDRIRPTKMLHFKRGAGQCRDHENGFARTLPAVCDIEQTTESARNEMSNANINSVTLIAIHRRPNSLSTELCDRMATMHVF